MSWQWQKKDNIDQPLHVLMGFWPVALFGAASQSLDVAMVVTFVNIAYLCSREYKQHPDTIFDLDLCFGLLGCLIGNILVSLVV